MQGKCQGCEAYGEVDDIMLCDDCGDKLEKEDQFAVFAEMKEQSRVKKMSNLESSTKILDERKINYQKLTQWHYRVGEYDFWPTTGKFMHRASGKTGRGVFELLKLIEK